MDDFIDSSYFLEEIQRLTTPGYKNNFDEYFAKVLPKAQFQEPFRKDYNYSYVSRYSVLNNEKKKSINEGNINKKKIVPKKIVLNGRRNSADNIISAKTNGSLKSLVKDFETYISLIDIKHVSDTKTVKQSVKNAIISESSNTIIEENKVNSINRISDNNGKFPNETKGNTGPNIFPRTSVQGKKTARKTVPVNHQLCLSPSKNSKSELIESNCEDDRKTEKSINNLVKRIENKLVNVLENEKSVSNEQRKFDGSRNIESNLRPNIVMEQEFKPRKEKLNKIEKNNDPPPQLNTLPKIEKSQLDINYLRKNEENNQKNIIKPLFDNSILNEKINKKSKIEQNKSFSNNKYFNNNIVGKMISSKNDNIENDGQGIIQSNYKIQTEETNNIIPNKKQKNLYIIDDEENHSSNNNNYNNFQSNFNNNHKQIETKNSNNFLRKDTQFRPSQNKTIIKLGDSPINSRNELDSIIKQNFKSKIAEKSQDDFNLDTFLENFSKNNKPSESNSTRDHIPFKINSSNLQENHYIPHKEDKIININNNFNFNQNNIIIKEEIIQCLCCQWLFPYGYTVNEKNAHIDKCFEGNGEKDKENYISSISEISKLNTEKNIKRDIMDEKNFDQYLCIICHKYRNENLSILEKHTNDCIDEDDTKTRLTGKKRNHFKADKFDPSDYDSERIFFKKKPN